MQKSLLNYDSSSSSSSPSSSSSSSSHFNSLITTHSLSSSSSASSFQPPSITRCTGLNLLVKAIHQVTAGSVIGVPYIQKRIVTRRRRPIQFNNLIVTTSRSKRKPNLKLKLKSKGSNRQRTMPSKYRDSVLQPLITPKRRRLIAGE